MWALVCRPHELCCLLHIFTYWEIDATLLCSVGLRYIWRDNEIGFCSDWRGWWHRYEIAVVFTWLLCVIYTDTSLSNGSFDLHQFMLIESQWNKHVAHCQLDTPGRLVCFLFLLNNAWEMIETRGDFYRKKTNGQADTVFKYHFVHDISDHKKHTEKIDSQWHLCKWDCGMWVCTQHDERGIHHHLAALLLLLLLLPLALALFTHPLILGRFHTPPSHPLYPNSWPCLHPPSTSTPTLVSACLCVLSFLFSLQCCYSNGEMWEYLRPSERGMEEG